LPQTCTLSKRNESDVTITAHWSFPSEHCPSQQSFLLLDSFPSASTTRSQCGAAIGSEQREKILICAYISQRTFKTSWKCLLGHGDII